MEEILASIRRIISDDQPSQTDASAGKPIAVVQPAPALAEPEPVASPEEEDVLDLTTPVQQAAPLQAVEPVAPPSMIAPPVTMAAPMAPVNREALISQRTDAAVASAFGSLAHTVLSQNARTIDDVVKEMLRPMLKSWLDDNLPTIVERLVRAEIERVARGAR